MLQKLIDQSYRKVNGFIVILSLIIFLLFILFILPNEAERSDEYYGNTSVPDSMYFYSGEDLYNIARDLGPEGRAYYIRSRFTFDIIWPLVYGFFLWAGIVYFSRKMKNPIVPYLLLLPIIGVLFDYLENAGASWVMYQYPDEVPLLSPIVPFFTLAKWISIIASFIFLVVLILYKGIARLRSK